MGNSIIIGNNNIVSGENIVMQNGTVMVDGKRIDMSQAENFKSIHNLIEK